MLKKNEVIELEITDITNEGNGVGRYNDIAVFVPMTAVGDVIKCQIVKIKNTYCYGIIKEILIPSKHRIQSDCPVYKQCGGCSFRHISYEEECRIKENFVKNSFQRIGKLNPKFEPIFPCDTQYNYRNKAQYPVSEVDGKAVCGFYARRSHRIVEYTDCLLQPEIFSEILSVIMKFVNERNITAYNETTFSGLLRHIYLRRGEHSGEIMVCLVVTNIVKANIFTELIPILISEFKDIKSVVLNENPKNTNVILGSKLKTLYGSDTITDIMCGNRIGLSPLSFYQVNTCQAEKLYSIAEAYADLRKTNVLLDLYCGAGTIGLSMCRKVNKLVGVEIIPEAIINAKCNAKVNLLDKKSEFICGDAGEIAGILYKRGERPDVIIADPARKGCDRESLEYMAKMSPNRIVMISCNHATAARDCAILEELGYKTVKVRAVDLFPRTTHVECVVLMSRINK
ncbi:MAG: 23S rRNA (uracil(1939)-C(5))-methyltransferase RlmD [Ruminococcus sp.]|nr:23S rRNA (uracil(1939)-C(5))-methyltransferase RlmD [Ruminococcus sp.]